MSELKPCVTGKPPLHRTRSHYVLENVAKRAQTVCERSGRSIDVLWSVYELHGRARTGKMLQNVERVLNFLAAIPSCN